MSAAAAGSARELRLEAIRREAQEKGSVALPGIRAAGGPIPIASPETGYYGQHLLKEPQWTQLIPFYFFVGGASGCLGVVGALADIAGREKSLARTARWMALGGAGLSGALLVVDLGRPTRFLNMLRVFKPQSPMSMGSWILTGFSASASMASFADVLKAFGGRGIFAGAISAFGRVGSLLFGALFHNYTGVLIGATVIPVWNRHVRALPREFGMSGLQSAVGLLELAGYEDRTSLNVLGLLSAGSESAEFAKGMVTNDEVVKPLKRGRSGLLTMAGAVLSGPVPIALRLTSMFVGEKRGRSLRKMAAWSAVLGSICLRYGWVQAGTVSARDWRLPLEIEKQQS